MIRFMLLVMANFGRLNLPTHLEDVLRDHPNHDILSRADERTQKYSQVLFWWRLFTDPMTSSVQRL